MARRKARRNWGAGSVYETAGGWGIRWREGSRRRRKAGFQTREDAERVLDKVQGDLALNGAGLAPDPKGVPTLSELAPPWLARRDKTHRAAGDDRRRWTLHLARHFGHLRPSEVDHATIRRFIEERLGAGLAPGTVGVCLQVFSALFTDLVERELVPANPCRTLPKAARALVRNGHDPKTTPFVEKLEDVRRIFLAMDEPMSIAYAVGAMSGMRTGEAIGVGWDTVDLAARRIKVCVSVDALTGEEIAPKDKDVRSVPIQDGLLPVLQAWKLKTGGKGLVIPPVHRDARHIGRDALWTALRRALKKLGFPEATWTPGTARTLSWYRATRHTFASHWVLAGGSLATLARILGHSSVQVTEKHYLHLRPDAYAERDLSGIPLDLRPGSAKPGALGPRMAHDIAETQK
jgi:integrase